MAKKVIASDIPAYAGIDVGKKELVLALRLDGRQEDWGSFANDVKGIRSLIRKLKALKRPVFACMEPTANYHELAARELYAVPGFSVMIANPRNVKDFARGTNHRSKTDKVDARVIAQYADINKFKAWMPAPDNYYHLRDIVRYADRLTGMVVAEKNRLHALSARGDCYAELEREIKKHIKYLESSVTRLLKEALEIIKADAALYAHYQLACSVSGIGMISAVHIIAETCTLPEGLSAHQWVACAGLDPRHKESGTSIKKPGRISRAGNANLRRALFFPAMVAARFDPHVRAFYEKLLQKGKKKLQAYAAIMRKLLHAIWGMFKNSTTFDGAILFPNLIPHPLTRQ